ncbi:MAG: rhodanese-like domain-containing protein [Gammaproteobacteria bacterium]|nr:rhodanese-like domain-containing protein [Gammaproteobacteria bacterium]MCY4323236.1 rhodanese-like domain-containing protein [Gammaproteobacteria bacterium]
MFDQLIEFVSNHPILVGGFVILLVLFVRNEIARGGASLSPQQLVNLVNQEGAAVVDLRDPKEYSAGHISGALNIPHAKLAGGLNQLVKHKEKPVVLACKMGQHSGAAGVTLRKNGFTDVRRLNGGMTEWRAQNLPVVKKS